MKLKIKIICVCVAAVLLSTCLFGCAPEQEWTDENVIFTYDESGEVTITFPDNFVYPKYNYEDYEMESQVIIEIEPYDFDQALYRINYFKYVDSLFLVKIIKAFTPEEAEKLPCYKDKFLENNMIYYKVVLVYDYLRENETNETMYFCMPNYYKFFPYPPYNVGDSFIALLTYHYEPFNLVKSSDLFLPLMILKKEVITLDTCVYTQGFSIDKFDSISTIATEENLMESASKETPRKLYQKITIRDLISFIKEQFEEIDYEIN